MTSVLGALRPLWPEGCHCEEAPGALPGATEAIYADGWTAEVVIINTRSLKCVLLSDFGRQHILLIYISVHALNPTYARVLTPVLGALWLTMEKGRRW